MGIRYEVIWYSKETERKVGSFQIPTEDISGIRRCFIPEEEDWFGDYDLSEKDISLLGTYYFFPVDHTLYWYQLSPYFYG